MGSLLNSLVIFSLFITTATTHALSSNANVNGDDALHPHPEAKFGFFNFGFPIDDRKPAPEENTDDQTPAPENIDNGGSNPTPMEGLGSWKIHSENAGVSAMHIQLMPNNKVVWHDSTSNGLSEIQNNPPFCRPRVGGRKTDPKDDCTAHAIEYDIDTAHVRPLKVRFSALS